MSARSQRSLQERDARSRVVKRVAELPLLQGNLQRVARSCGKPTCHCRHGQKHVSLYLNTRVDGQPKRFYIPWEMEPAVRQALQTWQQTKQLLDSISQSCLQELLRQKEPLLHRNRKPSLKSQRKQESKRKGGRPC